MAEGKIVKSSGGFYYIQSEGRLYECRARGLFKIKGISPLVGDNVIFSVIDEDSGYILKLLDRRNQIKRPRVVNVDLFCLVVSAKMPEPDFLYIDKVLAMCEYEGLDCFICVTKTDLDDAHEYERWSEVYSNIGYKVIYTSSKFSRGIEKLELFLSGKVTVFAGNSGVGKSSLANSISPDLHLKVGEISPKSKRGTHTTRHIELDAIMTNSYVADTPGFTELSLDYMGKYDLPLCFREFRQYSCRFSNCLHRSEPDCGVKEAAGTGNISMSRYMNYLKLLNEIIDEKGKAD